MGLMKMTLVISVISIVLILSENLTAQRIIVNSNGERIVMYPDGSWRLVEAGDSVLLRQNLQKSETLGQNHEEMDPSLTLNMGEQEEQVLRQWNELHFKIKAQEKKIQNEFRSATNAQFKALELRDNAEANKAMIEPDRLAALHENYEKSVRDLKRAKYNQKTIKAIFERSKSLAGLPPDKIERKLNSLRSKFNLFMSQYDPDESIAGPEKKSSLPKPSKKEKLYPPLTKEKSKEKLATEPSEMNVPVALRSKAYKSEPYNCKVNSDIIDETTGIRRIELTPGLLFTHTDPDLRPYFKNKELITCYGKLSKINDYIYLMIDFQIASSHSQSNFGSLADGSLLRLQLLNGEYVSIYNIKADRGRIDPYSGHTIFTGQYAIGKDEIKLLQSSELDKIRILWSTGYEDYDVYKIDFFIDQLSCLMTRFQ